MSDPRWPNEKPFQQNRPQQPSGQLHVYVALAGGGARLAQIGLILALLGGAAAYWALQTKRAADDRSEEHTSELQSQR